MDKKLDKVKQFRMSKPLVFGLIFIISLAIYKIYTWSKTEYTDNAYIDSDITTISAQINGNISEILIEDNQEVKTGDLIAKIYDVTYKADVASALAEAKSAEYEVMLLEQKILLEKDNLAKAKAKSDFAKINLDLATVDYKRNLTLSMDKYSSQKVLDSSKSALEKAKFENIDAHLNYEMAAKNLSIITTEKFTKQANLEVLKQACIKAGDALKNTKITSPIDGVIAVNNLRKGNFVRAGMPLAMIVPKKTYIKANFKETQIANFTVGQIAEFEVDAIKGYKFEGKIKGIYPATGAKFSLIPSDNATGNFTKVIQRIPVIIVFDETQEAADKIRTGMSVSVKVK